MKKIGIFIFAVLLTSGMLMAQQKTIDVPLIKQIRSQWCWAACTEMIDSFYFKTRPSWQCEYALYYLDELYEIADHGLTCPISSGPCDENFFEKGNVYFSFSAEYFGHRYEKLLSKIGLYSSFETDPTMSEIITEIESNRPLVAFIKTSPESYSANHLVVIKGYRIAQPDTFLIINDPWFHDTEACSISSIAELNYTQIQRQGTLKSIMAIQTNIHPKNMLMTQFTPRSFMMSLPPSQKNTYSDFEFEKDTINIPVKVLSIDKLKKHFLQPYSKKFLQNQVIEIYSPSSKKSYVKEKTPRGWVITEINNSNYPMSIIANKGKDTTLIKNIGDDGVSIWRYPSPPFAQFVEFQNKDRTFVTPLTDINSSLKKPIEVGKYYRPSQVMNRLRVHNRFFFGKKCFIKNLFKFRGKK